jgi:hypothetical protein
MLVSVNCFFDSDASDREELDVELGETNAVFSYAEDEKQREEIKLIFYGPEPTAIRKHRRRLRSIVAIDSNSNLEY